jgi:hypothetical protein
MYREPTDEEILRAFEGKVDPQWYRKAIEGLSHAEKVRFQARLLKDIAKEKREDKKAA